LPAAGKTGTSHDGWFAGFTSNLLAVAWVGYDDDRSLVLSGADSALPIWTEFMKAATQNPAYRDVKPFEAPPGVVTVPMQVTSILPSGSDGVEVRDEYFIEGTEPHGQGHPGGGGILGRIFHSGSSTSVPVAVTAAPAGSGNQAGAGTVAVTDPQPNPKKGGLLKRFVSIFKSKKPKPADPPDASQQAPPP